MGKHDCPRFASKIVLIRRIKWFNQPGTAVSRASGAARFENERTEISEQGNSNVE
jgi:hypothetical protein